MAQDVFNSINPSTTSGNQLATILNDFKDAIISGQSGTTRPSEIDPGGTWVDTTNDPTWELKLYDGANDVTLLNIDTTNGIASITETGDQFTISKESSDTIGPIVKFSKRRASDTQVADGDDIGVLEFFGMDDATTERLMATIRVTSTDAVTAANQGSKMVFSTKADGTNAFIELMNLVGDKVGINVTSPSEALDVLGAIKAQSEADDAVPGRIVAKKARIAGSGQVLSADGVGKFEARSTDDLGAEFEAGSIQFKAGQNHTSVARGTDAEVYTTDDGATSPTRKLLIDDEIRPDVPITGATIKDPARLDVKKDTEANLITYATTATSGQFVYATDTETYYQIVGNELVEIGTGSGSGEYNYYEDALVDGEDTLTGVVQYANTTAGNKPDDFGGIASGNVTLAQNTTTPLFGSGDLQFDKDAANRQGEGVYVEADIRTGDLTQILRQFWGVYKTSANYADGDVRFYAVFSNDNFVADFQVVEPAATEIFATDKNKYIAELQVPSSATALKVRLCLHVASTNATAYTINFDDNRFGPSQVATGPIVTDWQEYTPTISNFGTTSNVKFFWRRNGDSLDIKGQFESGTPASGQAQVSLPSGISVAETDRIDGNVSSMVGSWTQGSTSVDGQRSILVNSGDSGLFFGYLSGTQFGHNKQNANNLPISSGIHLTVTAQSIPISGWSSNNTLSTDYGNRELSGKMTISSGSHTSSASWQKVPFDTLIFNNGGFLNTSNNQIEIKESGRYYISGAVSFSSSSGGAVVGSRIRLTRNASTSTLDRDERDDSSTSIIGRAQASAIADLLADDIVFIEAIQSNGGSLSYSTSEDNSRLEFFKIDSPQSIGQSSLRSLVATQNSGQTLTTSTQILIYNNVAKDTHGSYNSSTGEYTVGKSGTYIISARGLLTGGSTTGIVFRVYINGAQESRVGGNGEVDLTEEFDLVKGDVVTIQADVAAGSVALSASDASNRLSIRRAQ